MRKSFQKQQDAGKALTTILKAAEVIHEEATPVNKIALLKKDTLPVQSTTNKTGLPDELKAGLESLSGYSLDEVKVHYNSATPASLQALAYVRGTNLHLACGQEPHLPHEVWHVVQQKQERVRATKLIKDGAVVNDDQTLEKEANVMGAEDL